MNRFRVALAALVTVMMLAALPAPSVAGTATDLAETIENILDVLRGYYLRPIDDETEARMLEEALKGLLRGLGDPYTTYMTVEEYSEFVGGLQSEQRFGGVGIVIEQIGDYVTVISPIRGTPAEAAGVRPRDVILSVDGETLVGGPLEKATYLIRGEPGTPVTLTIRREGVAEYLDITIVRDEIVITSVESEMLDDRVGYIALSNFPLNAASLVRSAVANLELAGAESLILDLRGNGGGYLDAGLYVADLFLDRGQGIVDVYDRDGLSRSHRASTEPITDLPMAVLIDGGSASASEIVVGALRDAGRARLVGTQTFGKGTVQNLVFLDSGGVLKVTSAEFLTPRGGVIESSGISPDVRVDHRDAQLVRAQMILTGDDGPSARLPFDHPFAVFDGARVDFSVPAALRVDGREYVPIEYVAPMFGLGIDRDEADGSLIIRDGTREVRFVPGQPEIFIDGAPQVRGYRTLVHGGKTYACLDMLQTFLGFVAEMDRAGRWVDLMR